MIFKKVIYSDNIGNTIAQVNKNTGELQLNARIFDYLPDGSTKFVVFYQDGNLIFKKADEFPNNLYLLKGYRPVSLKEDESGRQITVISKTSSFGAIGMPDTKDTDPEYDNFDPISAVANAVKGIVQTLPALGIGSKQRVKETKASYEAQGDLLAKQVEADKELSKLSVISTQSSNNTMIIGGGLVMAIIIIFFTVKSI